MQIDADRRMCALLLHRCYALPTVSTTASALAMAELCVFVGVCVGVWMCVGVGVCACVVAGRHCRHCRQALQALQVYSRTLAGAVAQSQQHAHLRSDIF